MCFIAVALGICKLPLEMAIFLASLTAGVAGYLWLQAFGKPLASDEDVETMDFEQQP
jgi:NhaA family Na+:H+ antiporter